MRHLILTALLTIATPVFAQGGPTISVSGIGEVSVAPDLARIEIGVTQEAETAQAAMDAFNADMTAVLDRLASAGVAPADLQTTGLSLQPVEQHNMAGTPRITGYIVRSTVTTTVRDLDDLSGLLAQLVSDQANELGGLQFDVADRAPYLDRARRAAVTAARTKADTFADAAGLSLGPVLMMQDAPAIAHRPVMELRSMAADSGVPIAGGEITISAEIIMEFALE